MPSIDPLEFVNEVVEAHGGAARWNALKQLDVELSARGALFAMKRAPSLKRVRCRISTTGPHFTFLDHPETGQRAECFGDKEVRISEADGTVVKQRDRPRDAFKGLRHVFYWDALDFTYFAGYATWNYLVTPFLFLREGFQFEVLDPLPGRYAEWSRLRVTFPDSIPTHSKVQTFYFDTERRLRRLDYTAEVVGGWAKAAHLCEEHREFDGILFPTKRRVLPLFVGATPAPFPTLVALDIHDVQAT